MMTPDAKECWKMGAIFRLFVRRKIDKAGVEALFQKHKLKMGKRMAELWATTHKYKVWPRGEWDDVSIKSKNIDINSRCVD